MGNKEKLISLSRRRDFEKLRADGDVFHPSSWLMVSFIPTTEGHLRCGWTLSRQVGSAVLRNKLRRWGRELVRSWKAKDELSADINIIFKRCPDGFYRNLKREEFDRAFGKIFRALEKRLDG